MKGGMTGGVSEGGGGREVEEGKEGRREVKWKKEGWLSLRALLLLLWSAVTSGTTDACSTRWEALAVARGETRTCSQSRRSSAGLHEN